MRGLAIGCAATALAISRPAAAQLPAAAEAALISLEDRRGWDEGQLSAFLRDPDPAVRRRAALTAARIRSAAALPHLIVALADRDTAVAATAAFALGQIGDTAAAPPLAALLDLRRVRTMPTVVGEAAAALGKVRTEGGRLALESILSEAPLQGREVRAAVGPALLAVWRYPRPADLGHVARWMDARDTALSWRAAYALSRRPDPRATVALLPHGDDPSPLLRSFALRSLTRPLADSASVPTARVFAVLLPALLSGDHAVSITAARTLGSYDSPEAVSALTGLLAGSDSYLAITAAESLARLGPAAASAAGALRSRMEDPAAPIAVRSAALVALAAVAPADARSALDPVSVAPEWRIRAAAVRAAAQLREWDRVASLARDPDMRVAGAALEAAGESLGDSVARIRPLLVESLGHPDAVVRYHAATALGRLADPADAPLLLDAYDRALRDSVLNDAAVAAIGALGELSRVGGGAARRAFFARFRRPDDYLLRLAAAAAFGDSAARAAWGTPLPIEGALSPEEARRVVTAEAPRAARIVTTRGSIVVHLAAQEAPLTVRSFVALARRGYFDGQEWPRVVPNFVIQGGDPRGDTAGGPGFAIRDEINRLPYLTGTLGMALSGPDTGGSQWFITHSPQPHLDGTYTVFGRVSEGMDVVNRILPGDRIERVELIP